MNNDSPDVGTSDYDDDDDVSRRHPTVLSFWGAQMLSSLNPLRMSTHRGSSCPITTVWGGMVISLLTAAEAHAAEGNVEYEEAEVDNVGLSLSGGSKT